MTKSELARAAKELTGGSPLIKIGEICTLVRDKNRDRVKRTYLEGLEKIDNKYFLPEVCERIVAKKAV